MTPDLQSTLDAIDNLAVHRCGQCDVELGPDAPSSLFCTPEHQEAFYAARSEALVGYREPVDLAAHIHNQWEEGSPETTVQDTLCWPITIQVVDEIRTWTTPDISRFQEAIRRAGVSLAGFAAVPMELLVGSTAREYIDSLPDASLRLSGVSFDDTRHAPDIARALVEPGARQRALEARRNRNTGPQHRQRAPRRIDSRGSR